MAQRWIDPFLDYLSHLTIISKEIEYGAGPVPLLDVLYGAQFRFLNQVCEGLDHGIHSFVCLKARQLGISTISLAMDCFWLSVHDGLQGALITDTEANKEKFRLLLEHYLASVPRKYKIGIKAHNRNNLVLANGSVLDYLVAGTKKSKDGLGRSRALNFVHATEVSSWGSEEGVASLIAALAQKHPHRLYLWESTARGYNLFNSMWEEAKQDTLTQKPFFIGWWAKEDYTLKKGSREYSEYWDGEILPEESELVDRVFAQYGVRITSEQIAWHRWMRTSKIPSEDMMNQEYPWHEEMAFIATGRSFFPLKRISEDVQFIRATEAPLKGYRYEMGEDFFATSLVQVDAIEDADLKIWEEPSPIGVYVMGIDTAFGRSDDTDRHCIEIFRCYADKIVQVAEYCTSLPETYQIAWVMCHLAGSYSGKSNNKVWINLEVSGPGFAIMDELRHLKQILTSPDHIREQNRPVTDPEVYSSVRWYLYHKPDSMGAGYVYNWKTNQDNKLLILNQLRDTYALRYLRVRSMGLLDEMQHTVQDGSSIEASGRHHDDRVFASALACKAWIDWLRSGLIANGETYEKVTETERKMGEEPQGNTMTFIVQDFFRQQEEYREKKADLMAWMR